MPDSPLDAITEDLARGACVLIDGATGTELERRGAEMHDAAWCAMATLSAPDVLRAIHEDYIRAGARVVTTNTFSTNRNMLEPGGLGGHFAELNRRAVEIALEARERAGAVGRVAVAGSMSHQVPVIAGADRRDRDALPSPAALAGNFAEMAQALAAAGVDLLLMEMMSDPDLANPAIDAARATGLPVWIGYSVRAGASGEPLAYAREDASVAEMVRAIPPGDAGVAGIMHSSVSLTGPALESLAREWRGPLMAYPDSGYFEMPHWQFVDIIAPADLARVAGGWIDAGVQVLGGCCGLGVEHVEALAGTIGRRRREHGR